MILSSVHPGSHCGFEVRMGCYLADPMCTIVHCLLQVRASGNERGHPMPIELHVFDTPNGRKISVALEEMALPYTVRIVERQDPGDRRHGRPRR
jgi:hypothetical protein